MHHYPNLGSASEWSCRMGKLIQPIRSSTQIWVVTSHQYGISALVSQTSFGGETTGSIAKCGLFSKANLTTLHCSSFLDKLYARRKGEDAEVIWSKSTFPARQSKWGVIVASRWSVYFSSFVQQKSSSFNMTFPEIDTRKQTLSTLQRFQNLILSCNITYWKQQVGKKGN